MGKNEIQRAAVQRQGEIVKGRFRIAGPKDRAAFEPGGEGLVQLAEDLRTGRKCRIKSFWEPNANRQRRSELLIKQQLADLGKHNADALGGAPYEMLSALDAHTPFAIVMKNINGSSWKTLKESKCS